LPLATQVEMLGGIEKNLLQKLTVWFQKRKATERVRGKRRTR
jgi:hypothetical protein